MTVWATLGAVPLAAACECGEQQVSSAGLEGGAEGQRALGRIVVRWGDSAGGTPEQSGAFGLDSDRQVLRRVLGLCAWSLPRTRYSRSTRWWVGGRASAVSGGERGGR